MLYINFISIINYLFLQYIKLTNYVTYIVRKNKLPHVRDLRKCTVLNQLKYLIEQFYNKLKINCFHCSTQFSGSFNFNTSL